MAEIRAVGLAIYTYEALEQKQDDLWSWMGRLEASLGCRFAEYHFTSQAKLSRRIWKATTGNRERLYDRLLAERPWSHLSFGWPSLRQEVYENRGVQLGLVSRPQPSRGAERWREPSLVDVTVHPAVLSESSGALQALLGLSVELWAITGAVYGFVDVETGEPPHDDLLGDMHHMRDGVLSAEHEREFHLWQVNKHDLGRRVRKAFWGNYLSAGHLRQLGGIAEMRRQDRLYRLLPEYLERAYREGKARLRASGGYGGWQDLSDGGVLLTLSASPLEWFEPAVQLRRARLQEALGRVALGPWDLENGTADIALGYVSPTE